MGLSSEHELRLQAAAGGQPDIERFLRSFRSVNDSLDAIERSFAGIGRGQDGQHGAYIATLERRLRAIDEQRRSENYRAWKAPLSPEAKTELLELLHRQDLLVERLQLAIAHASGGASEN